jgi:hypothetical protein
MCGYGGEHSRQFGGAPCLAFMDVEHNLPKMRRWRREFPSISRWVGKAEGGNVNLLPVQ